MRNKLFLFFILVAAIAAIGIGLRVHNAWGLLSETEKSAITKVAFVQATKNPNAEELVLPADVKAWHEAIIYSRINGYVKRWLTPFGSVVHEGELLAEIDAPELDAQLRQADADVKTAEANNKLAQITAERWKNLVKTDSVSKQEADEKFGDAAAKSATLASMIANRDHLRELVGFKKIIAPFDGRITSRTLDIGMLLNTGVTTQQELFHIVQQDHLRVYIRVPQNYSAKVNAETTAELHFNDHPNETYKAKLYRSAESLDSSTRTLLIEFELDNKQGKLFAGSYADAHIKFPAADNSLTLPVNTLIFRAEGLQVEVIDENNKARLKKATMGRDFGNSVEIIGGITASDKVIINPPDSLQDGQEVSIIETKKEGK